MRKANEARLYALTTTTACALALLAGIVGAPTRAVLQDLVFDQYQRWKPRPSTSDQPVRIVVVDEESLKRLGQWPWPREKIAVLVDKLKTPGLRRSPSISCSRRKTAPTTPRRLERRRTTRSRMR